MIDLKLIWAEQLSESEKQIRTKICSIANVDCYLASNKITGQRLFIIELDSKINTQDFLSANFRGLVIQVLDFTEIKELTFILLDNELEDIFASFIEDMLEEAKYCQTANEMLSAVSNIIFQWKKFFELILVQKMSDETEKGLLGELLFFYKLLLDDFPITELENAWEGPLRNDKDYLFYKTSIEVKLTSSKYPSIKISNERQLDFVEEETLYLLLFIMEEKKAGEHSLVNTINEIRSIISRDKKALESFNYKINTYGYYDEHSEFYKRKYDIKNLNIYVVDDGFPRIIHRDILTGIYNVGYRIELSACEYYRITPRTLKELIYGH